MKHMDVEVKLVLDDFMELGEAPYWDDEEQALYWVDMDGKCIYEYHQNDKSKKVFHLEQKVGCLVKEKPSTLIVAMERGFYRINQESGTKEFLLDPEAEKPDNLFNDGKCDCYGRFWAGTQNNMETEGSGALYMFTSDNHCELKLQNVSVSNGMAWTEDYKIMYYIDTPTYQVTAFDYDIESGGICNGRSVVKFDPEMGMPDGMTIDRNGDLWVAMWGGYGVLKCDPRTGEIKEILDIPVSNVTCCTFGGSKLDTLFVTTAKAELTEEEKELQPLAGGVFQAYVGTNGFPANRFGKKK